MPNTDFQPVSGFDLPRFAGVPTFMRLPHLSPEDDLYKEIDIGLIGVPWDGGTSNRPGARHGPRQLRDLSTMIRAEHPISGVRPFEQANCADLGDVSPNPSDLMETLNRTVSFFEKVRDSAIMPLTAGGDHLVSYPILKALAVDGPLAMIHFDAHTDLYDGYFGGTPYNHGTPFRRAIEDGYLDGSKVVQIGLRGTRYDLDDIEFGRTHGVTMIMIEELMDRGHADVMAQARDIVGDEKTYVTFDIDFIDPAYAPGTGTPEVGGPDTLTAQRLVRELAGLNLIGADLVEVSPPWDQSGTTAWVGASIMFELLCVLVQSRNT